jgi:hypothetical protein
MSGLKPNFPFQKDSLEVDFSACIDMRLIIVTIEDKYKNVY